MTRVPMLLAALAATLAGASCAGTSAPGSAASGAAPADVAKVSLDGGNWQFDSAGGGPLAELDAARKITMAFGDGRVSGSDGCNRYVSEYSQEGARLTLAAVATTKMFCAGDGDVVERAFLAVLHAPFELSRQGDALLLKAADGNVLRFVPQTADAAK